VAKFRNPKHKKPQANVTAEPDSRPEPVASSKTRRICFRLAAAILVPMGLLLCGEGLLRVTGFGYFPGFFLKQPGKSFWTENPNFGRRFFPPGLQRTAPPFKMAFAKAPNTVRVFVFGESAAMGDPDPKFGMARMLRELLEERLPGKGIEIINTAIVAIDSHVILPIAKECATKEADLWVIYMGNNEVIGPFGSASVFGSKAPARALVRLGLWVKTTRVGQALDVLLRSLLKRTDSPTEWTGMELMSGQSVRRDSQSNRRVHQSFESNLRDILSTAAQAGVPVVLCTVASNEKDCAPFASLHRVGLTAEESKKWEILYEAGTNAQASGDLTNAVEQYRAAGSIDAEFADLAFRRGQCANLLGAIPQAVEQFRLARDEDALQFRADSDINEAIRRAASAAGSQRVSLVDAEAIFATNAPQHVPGSEYFYEHVHLTPEGNYLLARSIADAAAARLGLANGRDWISQSECFRRLGLVDWNRYDAFNTILDRIQGVPFISQLDHAQQLHEVETQLARYKTATKPAQVRRQVIEVAELVKRSPDDSGFRWNLASLLQAAGDYRGAEEQWRALMELEPRSALPRYNLAKLLETTGQRGEAIQVYAQCLGANPEYHPARLALGTLLIQNGQISDAIAQLQTAVKQRPGSVEGRTLLARALSQAHEAGAAEKQWREVLRLDPQNEEAKSALK
jgi:tetratricopeptide (TPR) repeat protein